MISEQELLALLGDLESHRVERTVSENNTDKFCEAICAFANDLAGAGLPGYLLIGADDKSGAPSGLVATDELLQKLAGLTATGNILPPPSILAYRIHLSSGAGDIVVVETQPSRLPPVRYKGRIWIRRGPVKGIAHEADERLLIERRTAAALTFDAQPCVGSNLHDLSVDLFTQSYRALAIDAETIAENHRPIEQQLASLRFFDLKHNCPTYAGIVLFGKNPLHWLPNAYVQYVRFDGLALSDDVTSEIRFDGSLLNVIREMNGFVKMIERRRPIAVSPLEEAAVSDYPEAALREFLMNAVLHRAYDAPAPVRFYQYSDRIEIHNPGQLYGEAREENFPTQTSYRNPILAEAMRTLGAINRFGRGVERARSALAKNGSPPPHFIFGETHFGVTIKVRP